MTYGHPVSDTLCAFMVFTLEIQKFIQYEWKGTINTSPFLYIPSSSLYFFHFIRMGWWGVGNWGGLTFFPIGFTESNTAQHRRGEQLYGAGTESQEWRRMGENSVATRHIVQWNCTLSDTTESRFGNVPKSRVVIFLSVCIESPESRVSWSKIQFLENSCISTCFSFHLSRRIFF